MCSFDLRAMISGAIARLVLCALLPMVACTTAAGTADSGATGRPTGQLSAAVFTKLYAERVSAGFPGVRAEVVGDLQIKAIGPDLDSVSHLDNAYRDYLRNPADLDAILARWMAGLREVQAGRAKPRPEDVVACVRGEVSAEFGGRTVRYARERIVGDLFRYYCVDSRTSIAILDADTVAGLQRSARDLGRLAVRNITKVSGPVQYTGREDLLLVTSGGNYESSLILRPDVWADLEARLGPDMIFAVSNRDIFVVAPASSHAAVAELKAAARRLFDTGSYPVSRKIYRRRNGRMTVLEH